MPSSPTPEHWIARAQPWLGTLVEVALPRDEASEARFAAAFAAVARVQKKMNPRDPTSDLARIRVSAHRRAVAVDPSTCEVLELALVLHRESGGLFDPRAASAANGLSALRLEGHGRVRATGIVALDLGGIAKGYAVDRGVEALRNAGASAGLVNAGGDLRVFGADAWMPIRVRHPTCPALAATLFELKEAAAATSADYYRAGALIDPLTRKSRRYGASVTVVAPTCALSDALTKIIALAPSRAGSILASHGARTFRLGVASGALRCATSSLAPSEHLRLPAMLAA